MPHPTFNEPTLSIRLLWPYARIFGADTRTLDLLRTLGIDLGDFGDPDRRLPASATMNALAQSVALFGDPAIGLKAGLTVDQSDFDVLEFAARSAPNFGEAMQIMARYLRIMIESVEYLVTVEGEYATWKMRPLPPVVFPPAANDYAIASSLAFSRRNSTGYKPPIEVRLMHERPEYADDYEKLLETKASFGAPYNMIVIHKSRLDAPMLGANPNTAQAFQLQAQRVIAKLREREGFSGRVREELAQELSAGSASMQKTARRLGVGVATLRRRLEQEGTTFSEIVDELRKQLAERHLAEAEPTVSEVAFLLGFSDVRAFGRAFRRWTGNSPSEYRTIRRR